MKPCFIIEKGYVQNIVCTVSIEVLKLLAVFHMQDVALSLS
jgi:hypothetical protein